ncbi:MAG: formylglycine-generating enzyme family protein, partial [Steroidobacteraceae bacterium]
LHGLVWEWALDYNALLVSNDSREQGGADRAKFCGEGALSTADRENYAVLMRIGFLSSLEANYTTANLGFRCAVEKP